MFKRRPEIGAAFFQLWAVRPLPAIDSLIAALALTHNLHLVTRNEKDFQGTGVAVVNPWIA
ncbi:MAG: hypothetical protein KC413_02065 [Anaerolineales bacterium]|nr:hypothetical protein [Anaerolineales bacterium]